MLVCTRSEAESGPHFSTADVSYVLLVWLFVLFIDLSGPLYEANSTRFAYISKALS